MPPNLCGTPIREPTASSSLWEQDAGDRIVLDIPRTVEKRGSEITMQQRPAAAALLGRIPLRSRRRYRRDEVIGGGSGVHPDGIQVVLEGRVRLSLVSPDGRERAVLFLSPGCFFGEQVSLGTRPMRANLLAIADAPSEIGLAQPADLVAAFAREPQLFMDMMAYTTDKKSLILEDLARTLFGSAQTEIAAILVALADENGVVQTTHERLAQISGATRVTVAAQLHDLEAAGLIRLSRAQVHILDLERLSQLAAVAEGPMWISEARQE
jgi:CRP/FNR family cyclic AMP-dependent transcriptional regulator